MQLNPTWCTALKRLVTDKNSPDPIRADFTDFSRAPPNIDYHKFSNIVIPKMDYQNSNFEKSVGLHYISMKLSQKLNRPTRSISGVAMIEIWSTDFSYFQDEKS